MENFKFFVTSIIILAILGIAGFWAFATLESGSEHGNKQELKNLENKNEELEKQISVLERELADLRPGPVKETEETVTPIKEETRPTTVVYKYQSLINELQALITDNVIMKEKSRGTRVGTLQNFLNLYNNTTKRVDNDYGKTTKIDISNFQKAVGLSQTGETGPSTYQKMIDWLKKQ